MFKREENCIGYVLLVAVCGLVMSMTSGCAGFELGAKLGAYRVDERRESQKTYKNPKPAICYFLPSRCAAEAAQNEEVFTK